MHPPLLGNGGRDGVHAVGKFGTGEDKGQLGNVAIVKGQGAGAGRNICRQLSQDALNLVGFLALQRTQLVVGIHHRHRFDKHGSPR